MSEENQPTIEDKVEMLERLIKALTGAKDLNYRDWGIGGKRVILTNVNVDDVKFANTCGEKEYAGLVLEFDAEPCVVESPTEEFFSTNSAIINAEIWFWTDPWKRIEDLEKEVQSLSEKAKENE